MHALKQVRPTFPLMRAMARNHGRCLLLILLSVLTLAPHVRAAQQRDLLVEMTLHGAVFQGKEPGPSSRDVWMVARRVDGVWGRVCAGAPEFNAMQHLGRVKQAEVTADAVVLDLSMVFESDPWIKGGRGLYRVELPRGPEAGAGAFGGTFRGVGVRGNVTGVVRELPPREREAAALSEHPRLLFRKSDLPALRAKARTPFGKLALERFKDTVGLGVKYQLTGEQRYADEARKRTEAFMQDYGVGTKVERGRPWGWKFEQIALAYDLCYDAWPAAFRRQVEAAILDGANRAYYRRQTFQKEISWRITSVYPATIYYGPALGGMALLGARGERPEAPLQPAALRQDGAAIAPAKDYSPGEGVPVGAFESDKMPSQWLYVYGFALGEDQQALDDPATRPRPGEQVRHGARTDQWSPIKPDHIWQHKKYTGGRKKLDLTAAYDRKYDTTGYFYTVIRNDRPRWVLVTSMGDLGWAGTGGHPLYLNGVRVQNNDVVRLDAGLYPLLMKASIGRTNPWGKIATEPRLIELSEDEARRRIDAIKRQYDELRGDYQFDVDRWQRSGGTDVRYLDAFETGRFLMYQYAREAVGSGGFQIGTQFGIEGPNKYALAHQRMFGRSLSPFPDLSHYLPCRMFLHQFPADGGLLSHEIGGTGKPGFVRSTYIETSADVMSEYVAPLLPLVPEDMRPAVLWWWLRHAGAQDASAPAEILKASGRPYSFDKYQAHPVYAFLNYPLELQPQHPSAAMPLDWAARDAGFYGFRSGWEGKPEEFLVQVFSKDLRGGRTGSFRLFGFGRPWTHGPGVPEASRYAENVVDPADNVSPGDGQVLTLRTPADVGGRVGGTEAARVITVGRADGLGTRSIGVDFSGRSGAPCLMVLADRFDKPTPLLWRWIISSSRNKAEAAQTVTKKPHKVIRWRGLEWKYDVGKVAREERRTITDDPRAAVTDGGFVLSQDGATLQGTFVAPGKPSFEVGERIRYVQGYKNTMSKLATRAIFAEAETDFWMVVVTVQKGEAPTVRILGDGPDARVKVGRRTIYMDGADVVIE